MLVNLGTRVSEGRVDVARLLPPGDDVVFDDSSNYVRYPRPRADLAGGLYVRLEPGRRAHFRAVTIRSVP